MRATVLVVTVVAVVASLRGAAPADAPGRLVPDVRVREFALCPDGRRVVVWGDAKALLVDWPGGAARSPVTDSDLSPCAAVALGFSPDGRLYARTSANGSITILDVATTATRQTLTGHLGSIGAVAFSPDGRWLASGGHDNDVRLWDVAAGSCIRTLTSPSHATFSIVWAPDGQTFYTAGASRTVTTWNAATGERLRESASLGKPINNLAISADGRRLLAGTFAAEGTGLPADIRVLDAATFAEQRVIASPEGGTVGLAFSPDGRQILWASSGGRGIMVTALEE
jgi:Tol biopolymer transport system component